MQESSATGAAPGASLEEGASSSYYGTNSSCLIRVVTVLITLQGNESQLHALELWCREMRYPTTHAHKRSRSNGLTRPSVGQDEEKLKLISGLWKHIWHGHFRKPLASFLKNWDMHLAHDPNSIPRYLPREMKTCVHIKTCTQVFTHGAIYNSQKQGTTQVPINWNGLTNVLYSYNGLFFRKKKKKGTKWCPLLHHGQTSKTWCWVKTRCKRLNIVWIYLHDMSRKGYP